MTDEQEHLVRTTITTFLDDDGNIRSDMGSIRVYQMLCVLCSMTQTLWRVLDEGGHINFSLNGERVTDKVFYGTIQSNVIERLNELLAEGKGPKSPEMQWDLNGESETDGVFGGTFQQIAAAAGSFSGAFAREYMG